MRNKTHLNKLLALAIALSVSAAANAERLAYQLVEGKNGTGIWLSTFKDDLNNPSDQLAGAIAQNNLITSYTKADQLKNNQLDTPISQTNLRKTPALIGIDATSVSYNNAWLWGEQVVLDVNYQLPSRSVPWRSDYICDNQNMCRLITKPKPQFFELSYYLYANEKIVSKPESQLQASDPRLQQYSVKLNSPSARPLFNQAASNGKAMQWTLFLEKQSSSLDFSVSQNVFEFSEGTTKTAYALALRESLNSITKSKQLEEMLQDRSQPQAEYKTLLDRNGKGIFSRTISANGSQSSKRLVYQEQVFNTITAWRKVNIVASLELSDRTFIFAQPVLKASESEATDTLGAIYVFELAGNNLVLGVSADYIGALLSTDQLLEALRFKTSR